MKMSADVSARLGFEPLVRAVFAAGFRCGHNSGSDSASAYERGCTSALPQTADAAWDNYVQWRIVNCDGSHIDIADAEQWEDVP